MDYQPTDYLDLLERELTPATGCTEPAAVAYAAALARKAAGEQPVTKINILCSGNVIKNAMGVYIPGTEECGIPMAAALGAIVGAPQKKLNILGGISSAQIKNAKTLCASNVYLTSSPDLPKLYINVTVYTQGQKGLAIIEGLHDHVRYLERNGTVLLDNRAVAQAESTSVETGGIDDIYHFVTTVPVDDLGIVSKSIELNTAISKAGLLEPLGHGVGHLLFKTQLQDNIYAYAVALTAAGSDARMAGLSMPVMTNSGSGNQGICATVPVAAIAEKLGVTHEKKIRACALSNLIAIYSKKSFGRLSPLCGAVAAGIGAGAGIVYLMDGKSAEIKASVQNMLGSVMGMLCDGAKIGCAMKVSACTFSAIQSALIAISGGCVHSTEGIIENDVENTLENLRGISETGLSEVDNILLQIMTKKNKKDGA